MAVHTLHIEAYFPDDISLTQREIVRALELGLQNAVMRKWELAQPVEHIVHTAKYRSLDKAKQHELKQLRARIKQETYIEGSISDG